MLHKLHYLKICAVLDCWSKVNTEFFWPKNVYFNFWLLCIEYFNDTYMSPVMIRYSKYQNGGVQLKYLFETSRVHQGQMK